MRRSQSLSALCFASIVLSGVGSLSVVGTASGQTTVSFKGDGPDYVVRGAPFTAKRVTRTQNRLQGGTTLQHEVQEVLTRDELGRFFDSATMVPGNAANTPLVSYVLVDPGTGRLTQWRLGQSYALSHPIPEKTHVDVRVLWSDSSSILKRFKSAKSVTESLGSQQIAGLPGTGTRTTTTLPAQVMGNPEPLSFVHEVWLSTDLQIPLRELDINPFTGTRTMNTEHIERTPGKAELFHVPLGLEVRSLPSATPDAARLAYTKAMDEIKAPETREAAADVLVDYAKSHEDVANHVAHTLAIRDTHLADAQTLAESSVERLEQATSILNLDGASPDAQGQMSGMAEYWDSLGSVLSALGDEPSADRYFRIAWDLGGEGLYLYHIAQAQVQAGDKTAALHTLGVALSGKMDARETDQITRRAQRLGQEHPVATPEPIVVEIAATGKHDGSAEFNLLFAGSAKPTVAWAGGDESFKALTAQVAGAAFTAQTPDAGPEHILRRGRLECGSPTGCHLTLLYSWQAEDEDKAKLRRTNLGVSPPDPPRLPPTPQQN